MNMGLHGWAAGDDQSTKAIRINSTCTVFAGAELRDRLALGDKRRTSWPACHRAIILRAMSILARSGGIRNEFTFTGGVAKNEAAVKALNNASSSKRTTASSRSTSTRFHLHRRVGRRHLRVARGGKRARPRKPAPERSEQENITMTYTIGIDIGSGAVKACCSAARGRGRPSGWPSAASASAAATP